MIKKSRFWLSDEILVNTNTHALSAQTGIDPGSAAGDGCSDTQLAIDDGTGNGTTNDTTGGPDNGTDGGIDNVTDDGTDDENSATGPSDAVQSGSGEGLLGMSWGMVGVIAAVIVVLILTLLILGKSGNNKDVMMDSAFAAAAAGYPAAGGVDQSITPEQLAYEQQLMASGYPPEYARQYADQHFRPWLTQ